MDILIRIVEDALFAAIAAIGFAAISTPPRKALKYCALIAAVGHALRYCLTSLAGCHIVPASLAAAFAVGLLAIFFAQKVKCPPETFAFPSLLPMIPGIYAYRTLQAFALSLSTSDEGLFSHYFYLCELNGVTCVFIVLSMVLGQTIPILLFKRLSFSSTK